MIKINEIFFSIQGESSLAGWPTLFIRTSGCPLRCTYCDTQYAYYEGEKISVDKLVEKALEYKNKTRYICITGGEPLVQPGISGFLRKLCDLNFVVSLETSGSIDCESVDKRVKKIIDVKTPDSGAADTFLMSNLNHTTSQDEFKFVICSEKDFQWAENFVQQHNLQEKHLVLYSPSYNEVQEEWLANKILQNNSFAKLQLQLHKYIWTNADRGV